MAKEYLSKSYNENFWSNVGLSVSNTTLVLQLIPIRGFEPNETYNRENLI